MLVRCFRITQKKDVTAVADTAAGPERCGDSVIFQNALTHPTPVNKDLKTINMSRHNLWNRQCFRRAVMDGQRIM